MKKRTVEPPQATQVVALPDTSGNISRSWLKGLLKLDKRLVKAPALQLRRPATWEQLLDHARRLKSEAGLLFIRSGLVLPPYWLERLGAGLEQDDGLARIPAGNYHDQVNPLAEIPGQFDAESADRWLWLSAEHAATLVGEFPLDCVYLPPGSGQKLTLESPARLIDSLFVHDPARPLDAGSLGQPSILSALGPTRLRLKNLAAGLPSSPPPWAGLDGRSVTLHISHGWGGGVDRWIQDVIDSDQAGCHLVLASGGDLDGVVHGEVLRLFALGPGKGLIREMPLQPAIADSVISHSAYGRLLDQIIRRYAVGRILVSSLIGHSLDALNTGLPTGLMLHDFYPAWPLLHLDPLKWQQDDQSIDLDTAWAEHGRRTPFRRHPAEHWQHLRDAWLAKVHDNGIVLLAPTAEAIRRWRVLVQDPLETAEIIGHGFRGWPEGTKTISARTRPDRRLNIVIVGRLSAGKGLNLLDTAVDRLHPFAHLSLLGCGRYGKRFFGKPGVDIIAEYENHRLPELLEQIKPQAALFLSTVPETWNYTLSETRSLGIPPLATRLGSFVERIEHGRDGWLFDPEPEALIQLLRALHTKPRLLAKAAGIQPKEPHVAAVLLRYWKALACASNAIPALRSTDPLIAEAALNSARLAQRELRTSELEKQFGQIERELDQRTEWARRYERLALERSRWARSLEQEIEAERNLIRRLDSELTKRTTWAEQQDKEIHANRQRIEELASQLSERTQWAKSLELDIGAQRKRISELDSQIEERTQWAKSLELDIAANRKRISELDSQVEERTQWAKSLELDLTVHRDQISKLKVLLQERTEWAQALDQEILNERSRIADLQAQLEQLSTALRQKDLQLEQAQAALEEKQAALEEKQAALLQKQVALEQEQAALEQARAENLHLQRDLDAAEVRESNLAQELALIRASRSWRWTRPLRFSRRAVAEIRRRGGLNPLLWPRLGRRLVHALRLHGLSGSLQLIQGASLAPPPERPALPAVETPMETTAHEPVKLPRARPARASIIIPVYNKLEYTAACLHSIATEADSTAFEVIVVDDCSSDGSAEFLAACKGIEVIRNAQNSGFIASCNAGAEQAQGDYLVFLNNDTTVTPNWLTALLRTFDDFDRVGVAGARLVYPDGRLQESGGIIFSDANGWNYGRNESPDQPQYCFAAESDYVSGACLAVPRALFEELDGFDRRYTPAYYEDTDLCFRVRERGLRVFCQPACTIVHHEGVSSGTDESSGTKRYQAVNREKFLERWQDALPKQPPHRIDSDRADPVRRARFHRAAGRALLIDATTPMPDHDSGSVRFTAMLELMVEKGWLVTFMPQNLQWEGKYSMSLQQRGIEVLCLPAISSLENWLKDNGSDLDLVLVSRHYVLEPIIDRLRKLCPRARIVFDTVDLHFLREQRHAELSGSASMRSAAEQTRKSELGLMRASDVTLVVSPVEQELLAELVPSADIRVLSNIHTVTGRQQDWAHRRDLMFIGGFQHPPNIDAAEWLIDEIFPRVRSELPQVRLHLIGSRMPDSLRGKATEGVLMHGFVEDLTPYLNGCRLSLAPLRYGAGVKGKVNQAMAWGLPVVATACAAEGMFLVDGEDVLTAEDTESFARQVIRAYTDETLWLRLSEGGLANVERHFSRAAAGRVIDGLLLTRQPNRLPG